MSIPKLELISFKICPFVQRSAITLKHKDVPYDITYIDLAKKPDWFLKISPFGKVPLLRVDGDKVLFESAVINEYVDDITPPRLQHEDPLLRAYEKSWVEFGSFLLGRHYLSIVAKDKEAYEGRLDELQAGLKRVEDQLPGGNHFREKGFSLVDSAYAPLFQRHFLLPALDQDQYFKELPKCFKWAKHLVTHPEVTESVVPEFNDLFVQYAKDHGSYAFI